MKISAPSKPLTKGVSLIEAIIAVGVLAVAVPLVFGTMAGSGDSGVSAQAETRCSWIVPACVDELELAMRGGSQYISELMPTTDFPSSGGLVALAFGGEGGVIGKVDAGAYERGVREIEGKTPRYIASMQGRLPETLGLEQPRVLTVTIVVEYPAAAPAEKRKKIEFHTRMP